MLQFDSDGSGSLDFPEFLSLIAKIQKGQTHHMFQRLLNLQIYFYEIFFVLFICKIKVFYCREGVWNFDLWVQVYPRELWGF